MKIIFMGTPDFAVLALEAMKEAGHEIVLVVTQPDKPKGRGKELQFTPVKECAIRLGIPVYQPVKIKEAQAVEYIRNYAADIFIVAAFGQLLTKEILEMPKFGCVNIHASLLPKYRGAAPIQWAVIRGEEESGITIMQMDVGLDTGDMLSKASVKIEADETGDSLHDKLSKIGAELIVKTLPQIEQGIIVPIPQDESENFYAKMLRKTMGEINWNLTALEIERLVRGLNSWPSAYTFYKEKTMKIWQAMQIETPLNEMVNQPGTIISVERDSFVVQCGMSQLKVLELQIEGKKRMMVKDYLLGYPLKSGEQLGR